MVLFHTFSRSTTCCVLDAAPDFCLLKLGWWWGGGHNKGTLPIGSNVIASSVTCSGIVRFRVSWDPGPLATTPCDTPSFHCKTLFSLKHRGSMATGPPINVSYISHQPMEAPVSSLLLLLRRGNVMRARGLSRGVPVLIPHDTVTQIVAAWPCQRWWFCWSSVRVYPPPPYASLLWDPRG